MKCPSCGGQLVYNIAKKKLECKHCKSTFDVQTYKEANEGIKSSDDSLLVDVYCCKNCGAELEAPLEQTVAYCMYCGSQATLLQKAREIERPKLIIPFSLTKEDVKQAFIKETGKRSFVPEEFSNPEFLEEFRGIYIPYWFATADLENNGEVNLKGTSLSLEDGYDVTREYNLKTQINGSLDAGCYDASAAFDDTIASEISPFSYNKTEPFKEGYLAGFYSDKATASIENYKQIIDEDVALSIQNEIRDVTGEKLNFKTQDIKKKLKWSSKASKTALFPVWFLTWRKKDRVAYGVMNGETGKLSIDLPVDLKRFFKTGIIATLILFAVMSLFPGFIIPLRVACLSSFFTYLSAVLFKSELRSIRIKETHIFDFGDTHYKTKKKNPSSSKKTRLFEKINTGLSVIIGIFLAFSIFLIEEVEVPSDVAAFFIPMLIYQLILAAKQIYQVCKIKNKKAFIPIFFSIFALLLGILIPSASRPHDFWYYGIAIGCFISMLLNIIFSAFYINYLTTRPVPDFFTREGADNGKK